jgi:hypothetical protein
MASDIFDEMLKDFKTLTELKRFSKEQHQTILQLTNQIEQLKKENESLKKSSGGEVVRASSGPVIAGPVYDNHEENICRMELKKLHDLSLDRALTLEETKKVEIYTKLLLQLDSRPKALDVDAKKEDVGDLLKLVKNDE